MGSSHKLENYGYINKGEHQGDVYFGIRDAPPPYHPNAIKCYQCPKYTWRDTPDCVYCGADIRGESERRNLRGEISAVTYRIDRLGFWLIGTVLVMFLSFWINVMWLTVVSFIVCALLSGHIGKLQQYKKDFKKQLYQSN